MMDMLQTIFWWAANVLMVSPVLKSTMQILKSDDPLAIMESSNCMRQLTKDLWILSSRMDWDFSPFYPVLITLIDPSLMHID